jgi:hypothetical protein
MRAEFILSRPRNGLNAARPRVRDMDVENVKL